MPGQFQRPPGAPLPTGPGGMQPRGRDPFGLGNQPGLAPRAPGYPPSAGPAVGGHEDFNLDGPAAPTRPRAPGAARADGGEALLREALSKASQDVIEKIAWEVVPQLAETIIREQLERLMKEREGKS